MADDDGKSSLRGDERIVTEAKDRFKRTKEWESTARARFVEDQKFCEGDPRNNYQWDTSIYRARTNPQVGQPKPCLTINKTRQHCLQIVNDARQNKAQIQVRAVGDGATYEAAEVFEGIVRHIEYISNAGVAYETATWHQVTGGIGYWRVLTDYADEKSFEQEIYIRRIADPLSVYLDPDIEQYDGSDARFGFIFRDVPRDEFQARYSRLKDKIGAAALAEDEQADDWDNKDHVRVAEYYRKTDKPDVLVLLADGSTRLKSEMGDETYALAAAAGIIVTERDTTYAQIEWFKIAGSEIIERREWPGKFIPIVRVVGEETVINGELDRKGHTRAIIDAQRMYNFWTSGAAEHVALQTKAPFTGPAEAFEGYEGYWNNANVENSPYLPYNQFHEGQKLDRPQREPPPVMPQAYIQGMQQAQMEMMMTTGQYQAQMGENENAKSGVAIQTRQRQGDNATYHYIDHLAQAIKFTGRILIDLIPKIYDTPRVIKIMAEGDGDQSEVHVDPSAPQPQQMVGPNGQPITAEEAKGLQANADQADKVKVIFNPNVGKYDVEADIGPAYATRRQETFNALSQMMGQNEQLMQVAGDLLFRAADFPMADELAERFKRAIPKNILGEGPPPELDQAMQQNQALHQMIGVLSQKLNIAESKVKQGTDKSELDAYDAETRRMAAVGSIDPEALKPIVRELVSQALGTHIGPLMDAHAEADQARLPQPEPETVQ